jgi:hypothetical protein
MLQLREFRDAGSLLLEALEWANEFAIGERFGPLVPVPEDHRRDWAGCTPYVNRQRKGSSGAAETGSAARPHRVRQVRKEHDPDASGLLSPASLTKPTTRPALPAAVDARLV